MVFAGEITIGRDVPKDGGWTSAILLAEDVMWRIPPVVAHLWVRTFSRLDGLSSSCSSIMMEIKKMAAARALIMVTEEEETSVDDLRRSYSRGLLVCGL